MGAWGCGLFEDDVALDVKDTFDDALANGETLAAATRAVLEEFEDSLDDDDDGPIITLALAALQWERGKPQERLKKKALAIIEEGRGLERWEDAGAEELAGRRQALEALRAMLESEPPKPARKPRKPRLKHNYQEGDWFAVPLEDGGYAVGLIARYRRAYRGYVFCYFFGPRRSELPALSELQGLTPADAIDVMLVSDRGLLEGLYPILGSSPDWDPARWPFPLFTGFSHWDGVGIIRRLSEDDLSLIEERAVPVAETEGLPSESYGGYMVPTSFLSMMLREEPET